MKTDSLLVIVIISALLLMCVPVSAAPSTEIITESGYWTCPTGVFVVQLQMVGGGGGATAGNQTMAGYSGRNASTYNYADVPVVPGQRYYITIGSRGIGGVAPDETMGSVDIIDATGGGQTIAFGYTVNGNLGGSISRPGPLDGSNGLTSIPIATRGTSGSGNISYSGIYPYNWGQPGLGYGASGGAGGVGGLFGHGGDGGDGAGGAVLITYDIDAQSVMFAGTTYDAITGAALPSTSISAVQGMVSVSKTSNAGTGAYTIASSEGIITGMSLNMTFTKTGYYPTTFTFTPYVSEIVPQNIGLIPTTFNAGAPGTISGLIMNQYGSVLDTATITMTNATGGVLSTTSTAKGFYSFASVPPISTWTAIASKSGYANRTATIHMGYY